MSSQEILEHNCAETSKMKINPNKRIKKLTVIAIKQAISQHLTP